MRPRKERENDKRKATDGDSGVRILMQESLKRPFTLVIDELQEFMFVEPGIFGEIQEHWDTYRAESKMNLIVCGSVNTLMNKLFFEDGQPLYGRSTSHMKLEPFSLPVMKSILREYNPGFVWGQTPSSSPWTCCHIWGQTPSRMGTDPGRGQSF